MLGAAQEPTNRLSAWRIVAFITVVALAVGGYFIVTGTTDRTGFPDEVAGYERLHTQQALKFERLFAEHPLRDGLTFDAAGYGHGDELQVFIGVVRGDATHGPEGVYFIVTEAIAGEPHASSISGEASDGQYVCGSIGTGAFCTWVGQHDSVFAAMPKTAPPTLEDLLPEIVTDVAS